MRKTLATTVAASFMLLLPVLVSAQVSISNFNPVTENFNTLASAGVSSTVPAGWAFVESPTNTTYTAGTGSATTGDTYSFGAAGNSDRAFGELTTGSLQSTIGASFTNNTGATITTLAISYYGEQWRLGALGREDKLDFQYSTSSTTLVNGTWTDVNYLDFTAPVVAGGVGLLNGNLAANRTLIKFSLTNLSIPNGTTFWIRWRSVEATGSDDGLSIDDFTIQALPASTATGEVLDFGGTTDRVSLGDLGNVNDWTIETWFQPNGVFNYENLFHSDDEALNAGVRMELSTNFNGGKLYIFLNGTQYNIVLANELLTNNWHHVAVIGDRTNSKLYVYFDGVKKVDASPGSWFNTFPDFVLGRGYNTATDRDFNGRLDEFRIWTRALSQAEIISQKDNTLSGAETGLLAYYNFNQGMADGSNAGVTTLTDQTSNNYHGTLIGFTLNGSSSNWVAGGAPVQSTPFLSINNVSKTEGNSGTTNYSFTVSLSSPAPAGGVTFDIATADNTATTAGSDYVARTLTGQTISAGNQTYSFDVSVNGDFEIEANETFFVNVTNVTGAMTLDGQAQGSIVNDDALITYYPRLTASDLSQLFDWTTDPAGGTGAAPPNFTSPNQLFNLNGLVDQKFNSQWTISGGSDAIITAGNLKIGPSAILTVGSGSTFNFNDRPVNILSFPTSTGSVGITLGTITNATNVTVERYISSLNNRAYRLLAPSVNTSTSIRTNWQEGGNNAAGFGTHITGSAAGTNGFDATQTGEGSLFILDPVNFAWGYIPNTNATNLMAKEGYLLYVRGDRTINLSSTASPLPSSNTILRATGTLLTGPQSFTGLYGNSEFNLVTNPYASAINWASVRAASTNLSPYYTLWDPNIASQGGYVTIHTSGLNGTPGSNANVNIQSGQAFFVQSSAGSTSATVNILETHKSSSNNVDVFRLGSQTEMFTSSLFYTNAGGTRINADGVTSVYNNSYSSVVDEDDAVQMANWEEDIAISRTGSFLSIEGRPLIDQTDTIPFIVSRLQPRTYEWQFTASNFNHPDLQAVLVDQFLNTRTPIVLTGTTVITFTVTADPASAAAGRFMVVFGTNNTLPVNMTSVKAYQKGQHIQVEWTVQTEVAMKHYEVEKSTTGAQFSKTAVTAARGNNAATTYSWLDVNAVDGANYYRIKAVGNNGDVQYTKVVRMNIGKMVSEVISYPNPLTDNTISLSVNLPKGSYSVTLTNALGQQVFKIQLMHQGGAATQALPIGTKLAEGVYQLTVSDGVSRFVQPIIKQ